VNGQAEAVIRHLGAGDAPLMNGVLDVLGKAFGEEATYGTRRPGAEYLDALLRREEFIALAATADDTVIGGLAAYELKKFEQERSEIYIYDLAVAEPFRRRGIATRLIEALRHIARKRRACVIYVQADYGDDAAIALYSKLGTREDVLHFDIDVHA